MTCAFAQGVVLRGGKAWSWSKCMKIAAVGVTKNVSCQTHGKSSRRTVQANSLEDSKRRAKSQYDNIPDLNQRYLAELSWVERKYGPQRLTKDVGKEAQRSILRSERQLVNNRSGAESKAEAYREKADSDTDLTQYRALRNKLIGDTLFVGALGLCAVWAVGGMKEVQSFAAGLGGSLAYVSLLSRSVDRLGESARQNGQATADSLQPARIAILALLVIASAKNSKYLSVIPVLAGFFSYKVAVLIPLLTGEAFD